MTYLLHYQGKSFAPDGAVGDVTLEEVDMKNKLTSAQEVRAFKLGLYERYYAYMAPTHNHITTWIGAILASVTWLGEEYKCPTFGGWPSARRNFRARGIDGRDWYGTYYVSSGNYVRMLPNKEVTP